MDGSWFAPCVSWFAARVSRVPRYALVALAVFHIAIPLESRAFGDQTSCEIVFNKFSVQLYYQLVGNLRVSSAIHLNKKLIVAASEAERNPRLQADLNWLLKSEIEVGPVLKPPTRLILGNGYFELRTVYGARLFVRRTKQNGVEHLVIVGKAFKKGSGTEDEVFKAMKDTFPDFPEPKGGMSRGSRQR